ncbi:hypothetical protein BROUX41_002667 [Berkeleyomyces rouxiae]
MDISTTPNAPSPVSAGPSEKERKYDRQLRLWAASGQAALENARVLLFNSGGGTAGVEALKNLVLPGIGHFTIYDEATVSEADLGVNFFLDENSLGCSRAECCTRFLSELNPEVRSDWYPKAEDHEAQLAAVALETKRVRLSDSPSACLGLQNLLQSLPAFTIVLYALPLNPESQDILEAYARKRQIPILSVHSAGFYAYFNVRHPGPFPIIETHPDPTTTTDLRLLAPWEALAKFANDITKDLDTQDDHIHGHVPFVAILLHYLDKWKNEHDGSYPSTYAQKNQFRKMVTSAMRTSNAEGGEENFEEAAGAVMRNLTKSSLPSNLREVFDLIDSAKLQTSASSIWTTAAAIKAFYDKHGCLPVPGGIPDMKAQSDVYISLQNIYKTKAKADIEEVLGIARTLPGGEGVTEEEVSVFCKNAAFVKLINPKPAGPSALQKISEQEAANDEMSAQTGAPLSLFPIYMALQSTSHVATSSAKGILSSMSEALPNMKNRERFQTIAEEVARAGGSELHNISAAVGGMIAQEMIKIITRQYIPINNTHLFCLECANREGLLNQEPARRAPCPACQAQLHSPDDAVISNLNPTEDYKTSVLSGLSPSVVMECAGRALSFWAYQATQEIYYQQYMNKQLKKQFDNDRREFDAFVNKTNSDARDLQTAISELKTENMDLRRKNESLEKARSGLKKRLDSVQSLYDNAKMNSSIRNLEKAVTDGDTHINQSFQTRPAPPGFASAMFPEPSAAMKLSNVPGGLFTGLAGLDGSAPNPASSIRPWGQSFLASPMADRVRSMGVGPDATTHTAPGTSHRQRAGDVLASTASPTMSHGINGRPRGSSVTGRPGSGGYGRPHTSMHGMGLSSGVKTSHTGSNMASCNYNTSNSASMPAAAWCPRG